MDTQKHQISALNELLEKNYDAAKGYKTASENVKNPQLKSFFNSRSTQRAQFAHELSSEIENMNGEPTESGSVAGSLHRAWMDMKSSFSGDESEAILEECIRGEKASVENYREVMKDNDIPASTKNRLSEQVQKVETMLNEVKTLEDLQ